jgi:hypothetical protein
MSITVINNIYADKDTVTVTTPPVVPRGMSATAQSYRQRGLYTVSTTVTKETRDWLFQEAARINSVRAEAKRFKVADLIRDYIAQAREVDEDLVD